jgi:DDE superfamily endonuclease
MQRTMGDLPPAENGERYYIYGDAAYQGETVVGCVMTGFGYGVNMTAQQEHFTKSMNKVRTSVEWGFRVVNQTWASLSKGDAQKPGKSRLGANYLAAVILTNVRTCLNGMNQISAFFDCKPPTLPEYLSAPRPDNVRPYRLIDIY